MSWGHEGTRARRHHSGTEDEDQIEGPTSDEDAPEDDKGQGYKAT